MDRTVIYITVLGCPPLADICLPIVSCRFTSHKFRHDCALRMAYSLAQCLNFHVLSLQYAKGPSLPAYHWCFPDDGVTSPYILLQRARFKVRLRLPEWGPQTTVEDWLLQAMWCSLTCSGSFCWYSRVVFQRMKCTKLVTRGTTCQYTVDGIYEWEHLSVSKQKHWSQLMDLASACIHKTSDQVL